MLKVKELASKELTVITKGIQELLEDWKPYLHTITVDNGKEFTGHKQVGENLGINYFFAHPYHSLECGSNESLNGLNKTVF